MEFPAHLVPDATSVRHLTGGASRTTWLAETPRGRVVVRVAPEGSAGASLQLEARLLRAAHGAGVPVPEVLAAEGEAMVMAYVAGEALAPTILRSGLEGDLLAADCGRALAHLHAVPPVEGLEEQEPVAAARAFLDLGEEPHPAIEIGLRWLEENRPPPLPDVLVHGDFRLGNLMVDSSRLVAVLDWELAHVGDPREDLGWLCTKSWRFGRPSPVGGFADYAALLDAYNETAGTAITAAEVHWFEVLGLTRWAAICLFQAHRHVGGSTRSVELASLGRRVVEVEHDLLAALDGGAA